LIGLSQGGVRVPQQQLSTRNTYSLLMKLRDAVMYTGLIFLAVVQIVVFRRLVSLEKRFPATKTGYEALDRSLASIEKTVDALSSGQRKSRPPPAVGVLGNVLPVKDNKRLEGDAREGKEGTAGEALEEEADSEEPVNEPIDPNHPLARRKQFLEDIRARLRQLDTNADNQVSIKEFDGDLADFFYFDKNGNGRLSLDEIQRAIKVEEDAVHRVAAGDKDGDGLLSPLEFRGSPHMFRFLDANEDGQVSVDEYVAVHHRISQRIESDDLNHDHKLGKTEFSGSPAKFEKYDKNRDGFIDRSEMRQMLLDGRD